MKDKLLFVAIVALSLNAGAQIQSSISVEGRHPDHTSPYRVVVVSRSVQAINYKHRSGATKVDFAGTVIMPSASGQAKVESKKGYLEIEVEFANFEKPSTFGGEYLTYVLWAISPEGRPVNLGEVIVGGNNRGKLDVTTDLQAFALVVTAEPYYAVRQPSNVVVLENVVRNDTSGTSEAVNAKYELMERGGYIPTGYQFDPVVQNAKLPLEFFEARNALRIAESEGAATYAAESFQHAVQLMRTVDGYATSKHIETKLLIAAAREAVQTAEDSRAIAVRKIEEERIENERSEAISKQTQTQSIADNAMRMRDQADANAAKAQLAETQAQSDTAAAMAAKTTAEGDAAYARSQAANADNAKVKAIATMETNQTESASAISEAQADARNSRLAAQQSSDQADQDKAALRVKLSEQLNTILQTRDSARGLIVSMSDVLFDTGKYTLKSGAREKLAKVAGILLAYPSLNIEVGGYTDNVGGDAMNQTLSDHRAEAVRDYLVQQGVASDSVTATGFGNSSPVVSNDSSAGRQQNRRVELLVSGEAIGVGAKVTTGSLP